MIGETVRVHLNLHKGNFSVTQKGKVIANVDSITLSGATMIVSEAGRQRCMRMGKRAVHAWVQGTVEGYGITPDTAGLDRLSYNPFKGGTFHAAGQPVTTAERVIFANKAGWL